MKPGESIPYLRATYHATLESVVPNRENVSPEWYWRKEGKLNGVYVGNKIVVPKAALVEFILYEKNYVILKPEPRYLSWTSEKTCDMLGAAKNKPKNKKKGA